MNNFNTVTNHSYSASNQKHLDDHKNLFNLTSDEWAGFNQWKEKGRKVRKGAKACTIYIICEKKFINSKTNEEEKREVVKGLKVFNLEHTEEI